MRALIQRVSEASVTIDGQVHGIIETGLLVLLGVETADENSDAEWLANKISQLRIFNDADGKMNRSVLDVDGRILVISQFTLHASTKKGTRPSYIKAARPEQAIPLYEAFLQHLQSATSRAPERGVFGADMKVALVNDGPVTIWIDSQNRE